MLSIIYSSCYQATATAYSYSEIHHLIGEILYSSSTMLYYCNTSDANSNTSTYIRKFKSHNYQLQSYTISDTQNQSKFMKKISKTQKEPLEKTHLPQMSPPLDCLAVKEFVVHVHHEQICSCPPTYILHHSHSYDT